ncbi:LCP family protein, partial [Georgenia sp. 10Sc9-8]|nr:LCP family protein [Georgenia halotolerans]
MLVLLLALLLAWPIGLALWAQLRLTQTEALSDNPGTPGRTYLLAGSDSRADGRVTGAVDGERSDTIMVLHDPPSGSPALISLPRDTLVDIPGHGAGKLNSSYALGGPSLLVLTVEGLTGLTMDHYIEIGMGGVQDVVDAVGGVELCLDYDVSDELSHLEWTAGCEHVGGETALAFARMRYADPEGDLGRAERQRQVIASVVDEVTTPATVVNPVRHVRLVQAGTDALVVDEDTGVVDLGRMALAFSSVTGAGGVRGAPPVADSD